MGAMLPLVGEMASHTPRALLAMARLGIRWQSVPGSTPPAISEAIPAHFSAPPLAAAPGMSPWRGLAPVGQQKANLPSPDPYHRGAMHLCPNLHCQSSMDQMPSSGQLTPSSAQPLRPSLYHLGW